MVKKLSTKKKDHPRKGLRKSRSNQEFFGILFFLVMFYLAVLGSIIKLIGILGLERKIEIIDSSLFAILGYVLLGLAILVGAFLVLIIFIGAFEISVHYKLFSPNAIKARSRLREIVFGSAWAIITNSALLGFYLIVLFIFYFKIGYALFLMYLVMIYLFWASLWTIFKKDSFNSMLKCYLIKWKHSFAHWAFLIYSVILLMAILFSLMTIGAYELSEYSISLDKEQYFIGDDAYVNIFPEGLTKPATVNITYSNEGLILDYVFHKDFPKAPIYLKIPSEILKPEPYNSILIIEYEIDGFFNKLYRKNTKKFFIPVFNNTLISYNRSQMSYGLNSTEFRSLG